jgi:type II secretory pathway pseudopilin PulG
MKLAPEPGSRTGLSRDSSGSGFTLVEVMVATVLLSMIILGILAVLIGSYRVAAKARYNDHARYVVKSFADQFLTQQSSDTNGTILPLFTISNGQTGYGLSWTNSDGTVSSGGVDPYNPPSPLPSSITVLLGDTTGAPIQATVSRTVQYLYTSGPVTQVGYPTAITQNNSAGYVLQGQFTISYWFPPQASTQGVQLSQTVYAVRSVP